jgi:dTDP-4-amino-4,6-dideoxygalactose transaminase
MEPTLSKQMTDASSLNRPDRIRLAFPFVGEEELAAVGEVLRSGWLSQGPKVKVFERKFAEFVQAKHAIAVSSCTTALELAIMGLTHLNDIASHAVVPAFTFPATANAAIQAGLVPVPADVDKATYVMSEQHARRVITENAGLVIPVNLFGQMTDIEPIVEMCRSKDYHVVEDSACSLGSEYRGTRRLLTDAACYSFDPRKLVTTGTGGMLVTNDDELAFLARCLRDYGRDEDGVFRMPGHNLKMSDIQAAIGLVQLEKIDSIIAQRRKQARLYGELLEGNEFVTTPFEAPWCKHNYQSYVIRLDAKTNRHLLIKMLKNEFGIETNIGTYCLSDIEYVRVDPSMVPNSRELGRCTLTLPLFHTMTEDQQRYVAESLKKAHASLAG